MKFLIDSCISPYLAAWLQEQGYDALAVENLGPDPGDAALLAYAKETGRILVTLDYDFGHLIHESNQPHGGIIHLPQESLEENQRKLTQALREFAEPLTHDALLTYRRQIPRISYGPTPTDPL